MRGLPARRVASPSVPPTVRQLLVLADRSERGRLTADEAGRLRAGIAALDTGRRAAAQRVTDLDRLRSQVAAVRSLVRRVQCRGARTVTVLAISVALREQTEAEEAA